MAGLGIDINEIIKSAYETVKEIQQSATETVGTDCLWARATPVINSEDVVLQEYTLTQVGLECPKIVKVIVLIAMMTYQSYDLFCKTMNLSEYIRLNDSE